MLRILARVLGVVVGLLAIIGFFVEGEHLLGLMNVDIALDIIRVVAAAALLYVGFARVDDNALRTVLIIVGVLYVLMGIVALFSPEMFGMLLTGFTRFDIGFHLVVGAGTLLLTLMGGRERAGHTARA